jgi:signal transduction histidine kinase
VGRPKSSVTRIATARHLRDVDAVAQMSRAELEAHAKALRAVNAITDALLLAADVDDVFHRTLDAVSAFTHFPGVAIFALDPSGQTLHLVGARGFGDELLRAARTLPLEGSVTGVAVRRGELLTSDDVGADVRTEPKVRALLGAHGFAGLASVPLSIAGRSIGALNLIYKGRLGLTLHERALVLAIAKVVALAVERARHVEQLEQAVAARDQFLSIASHELKTPLTALSLSLQALARGGERQEASTIERVRIAQRQTRRLTSLIESLLDASRIATGRFPLHREHFELGQLVSEVLSRFRDEADRAGCALSLRQAGPVIGHWDRLRIDQVVSNLVSNAIRYGRGAPIECEVDRLHDAARVRVTDHGIGIARDDLARIFGRFERAVPTRKYGGLGLGLHIASEIVQAHGGAISAESSHGAGSTFTVTLPIGPGSVAPSPSRR